ncbi:MAG: polysaccharide biosynthesis protein [Mucilaginibacter sp.]|nr:polysaccharide biosynthesis protein [Mucilaginibacter sp.]
MINKLLLPVTFVKRLINQGHDRSVQAKKNIISSFLIKGISICISLVLVPLIINYINPSRYGIWLTLSSIVGWFSFFDIGLTQGLRNKFAEAKAKGDHESSQIYVSTTYAVLAIIFTSVWVLFILCNSFLNWSDILKLPQGMQSEVSTLAVIVFTYFCSQFVLRIVTTINIADQQPARASLIDLLGQFLSLIFIVILTKITKGSLINLGIGLCLFPVLVYIGANLFFFKTIYKKYAPKLSKVNFSYAKGLFNLGLTFFIIQVAGVIQFESANIIIARNFGTAEVTSYNIVYKYFGMLTMLFAIFLTPFWSASTEAYFKHDFEWIKSSIKKYNILNIMLFLLSILMLMCSDTIYKLWLGKGKVHIDFILSFWGFAFVGLNIYGSKYVNFLNGISALKIQFWACLISPILYIAIAVLLIKYCRMGAYSLFIAAIIANVNTLIAPVQYYMIIIKNKQGVWVR